MVVQPPALPEAPLQPSKPSSMPKYMGSAQHHQQQVGKKHGPPQKIREATGKNLCGQPALFLLDQLVVSSYFTSKHRVGDHFSKCSMEYGMVIWLVAVCGSRDSPVKVPL